MVFHFATIQKLKNFTESESSSSIFTPTFMLNFLISLLTKNTLSKDDDLYYFFLRQFCPETHTFFTVGILKMSPGQLRSVGLEFVARGVERKHVKTCQANRMTTFKSDALFSATLICQVLYLFSLHLSKIIWLTSDYVRADNIRPIQHMSRLRFSSLIQSHQLSISSFSIGSSCPTVLLIFAGIWGLVSNQVLDL